MKKLILFAAVLLLGANVANAQIKKGDVMLGGNIAGLDITFKNGTRLDLTPKAAWFVEDRLAVGGYAKFGVNHVNGQDGSTYSYGVGPLARYFFSKDEIGLLNKVDFFIEGNAGFEGENNSVDKSHTNGLGFGVGPGMTYFVTPNVGLEAMLKYGGVVGFGSSTYVNKLTFGVGLQVYLPGKKTIKKVKNDL
jgi:hypothetical protein